jgi:hypothetical protein
MPRTTPKKKAAGFPPAAFVDLRFRKGYETAAQAGAPMFQRQVAQVVRIA